jgi:hypothetical protein
MRGGGGGGQATHTFERYAHLPAVLLVFGRMVVLGREASASGSRVLAAQVFPLIARRSKVPLLAFGSGSLNLPLGCAALSSVLVVAICTRAKRLPRAERRAPQVLHRDFGG